MHQIQPSKALKDCLRNTRREHKAQTEDTQTKSIQEDKARRNTEEKENHTAVKELHCTSHL